MPDDGSSSLKSSLSGLLMACSAKWRSFAQHAPAFIRGAMRPSLSAIRCPRPEVEARRRAEVLTGEKHPFFNGTKASILSPSASRLKPSRSC